MNIDFWKVGLSIMVGSLAGALLRGAAHTLVATPTSPESTVMFAISGVGGGILGVLIGWTLTTVGPTWRPLLLITLVAALGTFSAAAISAVESASPQAFGSFAYIGALHIGTSIVTASLGFTAVKWVRAKQGAQ